MRFHIHWYRYVKTGIDFVFTFNELQLIPPEHRDAATFAGPIVELWKCRCGKSELRRIR